MNPVSPGLVADIEVVIKCVSRRDSTIFRNYCCFLFLPLSNLVDPIIVGSSILKDPMSMKGNELAVTKGVFHMYNDVVIFGDGNCRRWELSIDTDDRSRYAVWTCGNI